MSELDGRQTAVQQRPTTNDQDEWKAYWKKQGQFWRTEPEIDVERQSYLAERQNITPDIKQGIYPFKDIKLDRADVEWLLATDENGHGPIDWSDEGQRERIGLDIRGANLQEVDLSNLPLARLYEFWQGFILGTAIWNRKVRNAAFILDPVLHKLS